MSKMGFVYIWYDRKHKRYYIGAHWGYTDDGYVCSSSWMKQAYKNRPGDFKRRILKCGIAHRPDMYIEEQRWLDMIRSEEMKPINPKPRYYNLTVSAKNLWHQHGNLVKTVGQKISVAKRGKKNGPCSIEKAKAISETKKRKIAERGGFTEEHREKLRQAKLGKKLSPEHREKVIKTLKYYQAK